jgi:hypothetical protein
VEHMDTLPPAKQREFVSIGAGVAQLPVYAQAARATAGGMPPLTREGLVRLVRLFVLCMCSCFLWRRR